MKEKHAIITGRMGGRARTNRGFVVELNPPVDGKKFAVLNDMRTTGYGKAHAWVAEDRLDIEVFYVVGPEALLVTRL